MTEARSRADGDSGNDVIESITGDYVNDGAGRDEIWKNGRKQGYR